MSNLRVLIAGHIRWHNAEAEYIHRLARGLLARGADVTVWGLAGSPLLEKVRADGIPAVAFGNPGSLNPEQMKACSRMLSRLVREKSIDIVNLHRSEGFPYLASSAKKAGARVVRTRADMRMPKATRINGAIHRELADAVITANDLLRENLIVRLGLQEDRVVTARFGIEPPADEDMEPGATDELRERAAKAFGIEAETPVIGVMGRIAKVKGQKFALDAAPDILARFPKARFLVIYRDIEEQNDFLPELRRSGLKKHFSFVGPGADYKAAMSLSHVAMIPSVGSEAHCRVALEWMALAKPVIGSRVGVIPEIVGHGVSGYLVQPRYASTFADCAVRLLEDPDKAARMGLAGRETLIGRFTQDAMVGKNIEVFERVMERPLSGSGGAGHILLSALRGAAA